MDKTFWQSIMGNEYAVPMGYSVAALTPELSSPGFANLTFVEQRPAVADELLSLVETALSQIRAWC